MRRDRAMMMRSFSTKTVLITGATGLVGSGLAQHFAAQGSQLVLVARDMEKLRDLARCLSASSGPIHVATADLVDADSLVALEAFIRNSVPRVDVLINNAADVTSKPLLETSLDEIDRQIHTNVTGMLQMCRLVAPLMAGGEKAIVNVSSLAGYKPNPAQTVYSVSKAGVNAVSEALRAELGPKGFRLMNVALMGIGTGPKQVPVEEFAARLELAIVRRESELFLYRRSKWLMRLYGMFPNLARLR